MMLPAIRLIEGTLEQPGGYSINGREYLGEDAEAWCEQARQIAAAGRCSIEVALRAILPMVQLEAS